MTGQEVLDWLDSMGLAAQFAGDPDVQFEECRPLDEAGPGSLGWLARGQKADRVSAFGGSVLICALEHKCFPARADLLLIFCPSPKYLFSRVAWQFFPERCNTDWSTCVARGLCSIAPDAQLGADVQLAPGVVLGPRVQLGARVRVGPNTVIANAHIGDDVEIGANCSIGLDGFGYEKDETGEFFRFPHMGRVVVAPRVGIGSNTSIDRGGLADTHIGLACKIDNQVQIAHNVVVGEHCIITGNVAIAGSTTIGAGAWLAPSCVVKNKLVIGARALLGTGAVILHHVPEGSVQLGNPAREIRRQ
jgi:UDP-3-O-[3-hydroxymyristoyl] glucosamine N-acyltransferase LpxD